MSEEQISRLMNEGKQYLQRRNFEAAKQSFEEVIRDQPNSSEAFYFLSWIAHTEKQPLSACAYMERAYELEPKNKNYLVGLANIYSQSNKGEKAVEILKSFIESDGSHADVQCQYAYALAREKQSELAIDAFKKSLELAPNELASHMGLGELYYQLTQFEDALKVYSDAFNKGLKSESLYLNIAKLHVDFGEFDKAKTILSQAVEAYPSNLVFAYRLASLDKQSLSPELKQKLQSLEHQVIPPDQQFFRHWLLANFASEENESMAEMELLAKAHEIYKQITPFNRDTSFYLDRLTGIEPPAKMTKQQRKEVSQAAPVFIVGVPRCGSTLIENILCAGPTKVLKGEETGAFFQAVAGNIDGDAGEFWSALKGQVETMYDKHGLLDGQTCFTDKSLENLFLLDFIFGLYPNSKVIYCDRTPLATVVSILKNNMAQLPWAHDIDSILRYVDNCLSVLEKWLQKYPSSFLKVEYEALVSNPVEESKKIFAFCDLPWDESCLEFYKAEGVNVRTASHIQVRNEINTSAVSAFEKYLPFFEPFKQHYAWLNQY